MTFDMSLALFAAIVNFVIAMFVLARGLRSKTNIIFLLLSLIIVMWCIALGISIETRSVELSELASRITFGLSGLIVTYAYAFTTTLGPRSDKYVSKVIKYTLIASIITSPIFFSSLVYSAISIDEFTYGPGMPIYVAYLVSGVFLIFREIRKTLRTGTILQKNQTRYTAAGLGSAIAIVGVLNVLIPSITGSEKITAFSPLASIFFCALTAYSIVRHRLFDIRGFVTRAVTYIFSTAFLVVCYVLLAFLLKRLILPDLNVNRTQFISNIILSVFLVTFYPYVKKVFDKFTSKIFFRDRYDAQVMLDELNKVLVSDVQIDSLLKKTSFIIEENLKSEFCDFYIRDTSYFTSRVIGDNVVELPEADKRSIQQILPKIRKKIVYTEDQTDDVAEAELVDILRKNKVVFLVRLVSTLEYEVNGIGFYTVGAKKSGNQYSKQDLKILEIIANELVIAIENALRFEEIEQFNVTLQKKIDEATNELKRSNDKLKALDEAKDEFVSMASHQLRTPLTSIKGYISMVVEGDAGEINDTQKQMLGQALFSSQRMVYLISDLLNVSRLKTGKFIIESKPVYLPNIVESELSQLHEGAAAKNITLSYVKPKSFPTLSLDDMKIRQVIMNFTDNAIYYTPSGGKITVSLKDKKESVEFTVKDTGIGVPKAERHKLFAKFYRAENARKARPDGTGLGLFMAKKVIVAQGGSVLFDSKEGKGSTFGFSFPKKRLEVDSVSTEVKP